MWRKPGRSAVIRSMLQPGMGQSSFMPRPMGLRPPSPNSSDHHHDPRKARESLSAEAGSDQIRNAEQNMADTFAESLGDGGAPRQTARELKDVTSLLTVNNAL